MNANMAIRSENKETKPHLPPEASVPASVLIELQRAFFNLISQAETAKVERIEAKQAYDEKARAFEEARRSLFEVAEFLQKHQTAGPNSCDWMAVASERLEAVDRPSP